MRTFALGLFVLLVAGMCGGANKADAQGGTAPQSNSMGASRSGSAIDSDSGKGGRSTDVTKSQFDEGFTGQASGIGEKGSGQTQSTMERSEGKKGVPTQGNPSSDRKKAQPVQKRAPEEDNR